MYQYVLPMLVSFAVSCGLGPIVLPWLHRIKFGQYIREEGPESHKKKSGTPTMGGIMFLAGMLVTCLIFMKGNPILLPVLFLTISFGVIGFLDDFLKVKKKQNLGLRAWQKMGLQIIVTALFAYYLARFTDVGTAVLIPFSGGHLWELHSFYYVLLFVAVLGTVNGTNFTDGLDGLAGSVTSVVALYFGLAALMLGVTGLIPVAGAMLGGLLGFLVYNAYPARVFMGDTGSLALGGFVSAMALLLRMPIYILIVGFIYLAEVLSVIIQVLYFKATHGKRFFRMAPIHHHFELGGWPETRVVAVFTIVTALLCAIGLCAV